MTATLNLPPLSFSRLRWLICASGLLLALFSPLATKAAEGNAVGQIVAVVNDRAITRSMLESRLKLLFSSSNIPDNAETRKRFAPQVLDNLIDETLQQQEAQAVGVSVSEDDMKRAIADLEKRNNMPEGSFEQSLAARKIDQKAALEQIKNRLLWQKVGLKRFRSRIIVSEAELQEGLAQFARKQNRREFQLSEIVLPVIEENKRDDIRKLSERIVSEIRRGAEFGVFARQFSVSATALTGGDTGWMPEDRLEKEALPKLLQTNEGEVTDPIETANSFRIYRVNKRFDPKNTEVSLQQFLLSSPYPAEANEHMQVASHILKGCSNIDEAKQGLLKALPESAAANLSVLDLGRISLSDLASEFRDAVAQLEAGQASAIMPAANGLTFFVVCDRSAVGTNQPDSEKVKEVLSREKLDLESRRYLSQIRRAAFIEKR